MNVKNITKEILQLPPKTRAVIAETIWESLEEPYKFITDRTENQTIDLALSRDKEIDSGKTKPVSHKNLMRNLHR